ncbi:hypothetical protein [Methylobacterium sp. sgz302541]|uniref:hypothetical protein n=1 Tax=unclassified Methylobacterium TaxID=2615210 RepID=UPI003D356627
MSDVAFEAHRNTLAPFGMVPQVEMQRMDMDELSMDELDEANGGLMVILMAAAFMAGYGGMSFYQDHWGQGRTQGRGRR